jgi:hypothetical protein
MFWQDWIIPVFANVGGAWSANIGEDFSPVPAGTAA